MTETDASAAERTGRTISRRAALRAAGGAVVAGSALGAAPTGARAQSGGTDLESWFEDTSNYDGVEDRTGEDEVTVEVGVEANDGAFGFGPAAIRVSPGTTVVWEWTGEGGSHDVAHVDGDFASDLVDESGHTFEHTFESEGTYAYSCTPHEMMGMKGAVVVGEGESGGAGGAGGGADGDGGASGNGDGSTGTDDESAVAAPFGDSGARRLWGLALGGTFAAALASPGLFGAFVWLKERSRERAASAPGSNADRDPDEAV